MEAHNNLISALVNARALNQPLPLQQAIKLCPQSTSDAYTIQKGIAKELGWFKHTPPQIWKLGGTKETPTAAALDESVLHYHLNKEPHVLYESEACTFTGLELELVVKLNKTVKPGDSLNEVITAVGEVYLALEICDQRAETWEKLPDLFRLADHQMNRSLILFNQPLQEWHENLTKIAPSIHLGSEVMSDGILNHPQGHPLGALPWLASLSEELYQQPLNEGTLIATGTWSGIQMLTEDRPFFASLKGFQDIKVTLQAHKNN